MMDNWNELFNALNEEDILRNLPDDLPEMEDELAAKRIEKRVLEELDIDRKMQKKQNRKRFLVAAVCCIVVVGIFGREPIQAAFQRWFHDLPGVGLYINDENTEVYEVQIDNPVQEKDGIRIELKDFYCEDKMMKGKIRITGENLGLLPDGRWILGEDENCNEALNEKFKVTWYAGEESVVKNPNGTTVEWNDDGKITLYEMRFRRYLRLQAEIDTYQIQIDGFDERFTLKIVEPKAATTPEEIGYSVTKNDTSVIARATVKENNILEVEYFVIPSAEVKAASEKNNRFQLMIAAYAFDFENYFYIENAKGERLKGKYETMGNGGKYLLQGTEEDFPLKLHYSPFTGTNDETHTVTVPLPEKGNTVTENLPKVNFKYGTVEILSATQPNSADTPATEVTITYRTIPKAGERRMYAVVVELPEEYERSASSSTGEEKDGYYVQTTTFKLAKQEGNTLDVIFDTPSYWIEGAYDVVIEKPMTKE